ncbi:MAG: hypothetical protein RXP97_06255 [Nitrososphaeria archaeon]|jgi:hypothetical protein
MDPSFKLIVDDEEVASGVLRRAIAPSVASDLERMRRVAGNVLMRDNAIGIVTHLKVGSSKSRRNFRRGEVALSPADGTMWFFTGDSESRMPLVPLGNITMGIDSLSAIRRGARLALVVSSGQGPP